MASIRITGIDELIGGLSRRANSLRPIIEEALAQSAEVVKEKMQDEEAGSFVDPSGELGETIECSRVWHSPAASGIYVRFEGNYVGRRGRARRSGLVAAMVEYKHGNPWVKRSMKKSRRRINAIMAEELGGRTGTASDWGGL